MTTPNTIKAGVFVITLFLQESEKLSKEILLSAIFSWHGLSYIHITDTMNNTTAI